MKQNALQVNCPQSLIELVQYLEKADEKTTILAGGTDWMLQWKQGEIHQNRIIDINRIPETKGIRIEEDMVIVGATSTFNEILSSQALQRCANILVQAAESVGSTQIRNVATVGGNIVNAAPCADSVTALMALDAKLRMINGKGEFRETELADVIHKQGDLAMKPDEVLIEVFFPKPPLGAYNGFAKLGDRSTVSISKLNAGLSICCKEGIIKKASISLGAIGPKAFVSETIGQELMGNKMDEKMKKTLIQSVVQLVDRSISGRKSHPYKREAVKGLMEDLIANLKEVVKHES